MTIFQKILDGKIPADKVYEDDRALAFRDIRPTAPVHVLVIPKQAIPGIAHATAADEGILGHLLLVAAEVGRRLGLDARGYRLIVNEGPDAGQSVAHLHVHVIGGRTLGWPPG